MTDVFWIQQIEADVPSVDDWLTATETSNLKTLRFVRRRADWRLGRWTAKCALTSYLRDHPALEEIEIRPAPSGAPEVFIANQKAPVAISLSHRDGTAVCAIAEGSVALGCDLEVIEPRSEAFFADYFTAEEQALVARASTADVRSYLLALLWSGKESALKALRTGLRADTRSVTVSLSPPEQSNFDDWTPLEVRYREGYVFHGWWQRTGSLVRTIIANPPPSPPLALSLSTHNSELR